MNMPHSVIEISKEKGISAEGPIAWAVVIICALFAMMYLEKKFDLRFRIFNKIKHRRRK